MPLSYRAAQTAIKRADEPGLRSALSSGLDANLTNQNGWSLLMLAAIEGQTAMGRLLIEHGADVNRKNRHGETALSLAAHKGHIFFIQLLRQHHASTECRPHGVNLSRWLEGAGGLSAPQLAAVLEAISAHPNPQPNPQIDSSSRS